MNKLFIGFIRAWRRYVSPLYGDVCKFYPTCSAYGLEAVELHGWLKGSALALARLMRCHPWSAGGYDPVPGSPLEQTMGIDAPWALNVAGSRRRVRTTGETR